MAYSTTNPPSLTSVAPLTGAGQVWQYRSTELGSAVDAAGYFTNAQALGMRVGDMVLVYESTNVVFRSHVVLTVSSTGADLSDGATMGSTTNSD